MTEKTKAPKPHFGFRGLEFFGLIEELPAPHLPGPETPVGKPECKTKPITAAGGGSDDSVLAGRGLHTRVSWGNHLLIGNLRWVNRPPSTVQGQRRRKSPTTALKPLRRRKSPRTAETAAFVVSTILSFSTISQSRITRNLPKFLVVGRIGLEFRPTLLRQLCFYSGRSAADRVRWRFHPSRISVKRRWRPAWCNRSDPSPGVRPRSTVFRQSRTMCGHCRKCPLQDRGRFARRTSGLGPSTEPLTHSCFTLEAASRPATARR